MPSLLNKLNAVTSSESIRESSIVDFENSGRCLAALVLSEKKGKWSVLDERGRESQLSSDRLFLLSARSDLANASNSERISFLSALSQEAQSLENSLNLEEVWDVVRDTSKKITVSDVCDLVYGENGARERLAAHRALLEDKIFFKRHKTHFEPRAPELVDELKLRADTEAKKEAKREQLLDSILSILKGEKRQLPPNIREIEQLAVFGTQAPDAKNAISLLEHVVKTSGLTLQGTAERKAFELLVAVGRFSPDENLSIHRFGRSAEFEANLCEMARDIAAATTSLQFEDREDFTHLHAITIDDEATRDIDDALTIETTQSGYRLGIHISDVTALVDESSPLAEEALQRGSSIYCPNFQIPMFPPAISQNAASLISGANRFALSFFVELDSQYAIKARLIKRTIICVRESISYDEVDELLYGDKGTGSTLEHEKSQMLLKFWEIASCLENRRISKGAVSFFRREKTPVVLDDGKIILEHSSEDSPSRKLVEEMMILANETAAQFAADNCIPIIFRCQEKPDIEIDTVGLDIPEGLAREYAQRSQFKRSLYMTKPSAHFGLGLSVYTQVTSPIRRAIDLLNQYQLVRFLLTNSLAFEPQRLDELLSSLETHLAEVFTIQREANRYWLLKYLQQERISEICGTVVKISGKRPLAELDILHSLQPFTPVGSNRSSRSGAPKCLGELVRLKIQHIDPREDSLVLMEMSPKTS
ncbi:MAG: RNB domain-containing ribonuclease [Deltaproteobacteria bacterium]|nr:RNB domain-containing ribonuclease [Deltaproteobacteria bacterium]